MNETEGRMGGNGLDDVAVLRLLVAATVLLLCIFIGCIDMTLRHQTVVLGTQLENTQKVWDAYEKNEQKFDQMRVHVLFDSLNDYVKTHPDFAPIVQAAERNLVVAPGPGKKK